MLKCEPRLSSVEQQFHPMSFTGPVLLQKEFGPVPRTGECIGQLAERRSVLDLPSDDSIVQMNTGMSGLQHDRPAKAATVPCGFPDRGDELRAGYWNSKPFGKGQRRHFVVHRSELFVIWYGELRRSGESAAASRQGKDCFVSDGNDDVESLGPCKLHKLVNKSL
jgi:hypothetical protein